MAFTVTLSNLAAFAGASNLQLFLRKTSDKTLVNTGGDTGVDASSVGAFSWTVSEDRPAEKMLARIYEGSSETAANLVIDSELNVGYTEIGAGGVELDSDARVKLAADQPDYAPLKAPELRGDLTLDEAVDLLVAALVGVTSQPSGTTEKFKFVDGADAFTTTFDSNGNRTGVALA